MRIWIIEDDEQLRDIIYQALRPLSTRIVLCDEVKMIDPNAGDLVLMDMHGTQSHLLKSNGAHIIRMTGDPGLPADLYKPFGLDELVNLVERKIAELDAD